MNYNLPKCILYMVTGLDEGGAEKIVCELSKGIRHFKFIPIIVVLKKNADNLIPKLKETNVIIFQLKMNKNIFGVLNSLLEIRKIVLHYKVRVIHAHLFHAMLMACIVKLVKPSIKVIWTAHSINLGSFVRELITFLLRPFRNADILFFKGMNKFYNIKNQYTIANGISFLDNNTIIQKNDKFTFLAVGRLEKVKNFKFLINTMKFLNNNTQLLIAGSGSQYKYLSDLINRNQLSDRVKLIGQSNEISLLMKQSHCLLLCSKWEGMPLVIIEAGFFSLPIITTPVGAIPYFFKSNY